MADNAQSILRRLRELSDNPRGSLEQLVDQLNNFNKGRVAVINDRGAGYRNLSQEERVKQIVQGALDNVGSGGLGALGVIKTKGGNWLTGSVENALSGLKKGLRDEDHVKWMNDVLSGALQSGDTRAIEAVRRDLASHNSGQALNNWIEGPLTKYVKRDMATEGDPVRKLAEQGILHINPDAITRNVDSATYANRGAAGFSPWGVAESDLAKSWENLSDRSVASGFAGRMSESAKAQNPWLEKLAAEERVYQPSKIGHEGLGFNHLTDELSNALNPESGLPRHLQLTPEQMQQLGMEKAVRHVHDINQWRQEAAKTAKLSSLKNAATLRDYPEGYKWVTIPDTSTKEGLELSKTLGCEGGWCTQGDEAARRYGSGGNKLHVLIDPEGRAVTQVATRPGVDTGVKPGEEIWPDRELIDATYEKIPKRLHKKFGDWVEENYDTYDSIYDAIVDSEWHKYLPYSNQVPANIVEIKGKFNKKPDEAHLPFVQDFVRNHPEGGQWGDIGDLHNTGLRRTSDAWNTMEQARIKSKGIEIPDYMTQADIDAIEKQVWAPDGYAQGGQVTANTTWRPMELDGIIGYITE